MPRKSSKSSARDSLRASRTRTPAQRQDPDSQDGVTVISGWGISLTVDWDQLGTANSFQDVSQLMDAVVAHMQEETGFGIDNTTQIMLLPSGSMVALDPAATLEGYDGKVQSRRRMSCLCSPLTGSTGRKKSFPTNLAITGPTGSNRIQLISIPSAT